MAVLALIFGTAAPSFAASAPAVPATAQTVAGGPVKTSLAGFNAGNIISDAVFTNELTMTEAQIQTFFNSKVKTCRGGIDEDGRPIVCLKDYKTDTVNRPADTYCKGYTGATGESAARIIYRVSQSCNINPQVLIVMLQKEQSLVTHTWPSAWRYDKALGQGCPDDAGCNPKYVGFFYQIYGAARQMQTYMEGQVLHLVRAGQDLEHPVPPEQGLRNRARLRRQQGDLGALLLHPVPAQCGCAEGRVRHGRLLLELRQQELLQLLHRLVRVDAGACVDVTCSHRGYRDRMAAQRWRVGVLWASDCDGCVRRSERWRLRATVQSGCDLEAVLSDSGVLDGARTLSDELPRCRCGIGSVGLADR
nr:hypothetical protein [Microbacterium sp. W4I4]